MDTGKLRDHAKKYDDLYREIEDRLDQLLRADQQRRLAQIDLQTIGFDPRELDTYPDLDLTPDQVKAMWDLHRAEVRVIDERPEKEPATAEERQKELDRIVKAHRQTLDEISGLLDERQRRVWDAMVGTPFHCVAHDPGEPAGGSGWAPCEGP